MARGGLFLGVLLLLLAGADAAPSPQAAGEGVDELHGVASLSDHAENTDGACRYGDNVGRYSPFMQLVTGFGNITNDCGVCYRVICTGHPACSTRGVRVTKTDICRSPLCARGAKLFELSDRAFGEMAETGRADELRAAGLVAVRYQREDCYYSPTTRVSFPGFRVDPSSTNESFSVTIVFIEGKADPSLQHVLFLNNTSSWPPSPFWHQLDRIDGATWKSFDIPVVTPPLTISVTMPWSGGRTPNPQVVTALDIIPANWRPGDTYFPKGTA